MKENILRIAPAPTSHAASQRPYPNPWSEDAKGSVARLRLTDFRNHVTTDLVTDSRPVVLTGANGAGKTNILEALSFLAPGRGLRGARLSEVGRRSGAEETGRAWAVASRLRGSGGEVHVGVGIEPNSGDETDETGERRSVHIDGVRGFGPRALGDLVRVSWLIPQMDRLFLEGASGRRRFLDRLTLGLDPAHATRAAAYERALKERMRLLEAGSSDARWLSALEDRMAAEGIALAASRRDTVARLNGAIAASEGPFPRALLAIQGIETWLDETPATEAEDRFRLALAEGRRDDAAAGRALIGPHRSDLSAHHGGTGEAVARCSTGEQKALLIGVMLANARLQSLESGATALLLLDEVAAHLDADRRRALFDEISGLAAQAWLTGTDESLFAGFGERAQFFTVEHGAVARRSV